MSHPRLAFIPAHDKSFPNRGVGVKSQSAQQRKQRSGALFGLATEWLQDKPFISERELFSGAIFVPFSC
jgi:hypothetical protein